MHGWTEHDARLYNDPEYRHHQREQEEQRRADAERAWQRHMASAEFKARMTGWRNGARIAR